MRAIAAHTGRASVTAGRMKYNGVAPLPAAHRQPAQRQPKQEREQRTGDEGRQSDGERCEAGDGEVDGASASQRGPDAERHPAKRRECKRGEADRHADRQSLCDEAGDALIAQLVRKAEVAVGKTFEIMQILHAEGPVEAVEMIEIGAHLRRQGTLLVEGAAGGQTDDEEGERDENQQGRDGSGNAAERVPKHTFDANPVELCVQRQRTILPRTSAIVP